jgi:hypothetical protein
MYLAYDGDHLVAAVIRSNVSVNGPSLVRESNLGPSKKKKLRRLAYLTKNLVSVLVRCHGGSSVTSLRVCQIAVQHVLLIQSQQRVALHLHCVLETEFVTVGLIEVCELYFFHPLSERVWLSS